MQVLLNCSAAGAALPLRSTSMVFIVFWHFLCCTLRPVGVGEHLPSPPMPVPLSVCLPLSSYPPPFFSVVCVCVLNRSSTIIDQGRSIATNLVSGRLEPVLFSLGKLNITLFVVECVCVCALFKVCLSTDELN